MLSNAVYRTEKKKIKRFIISVSTEYISVSEVEMNWYTRVNGERVSGKVQQREHCTLIFFPRVSLHYFIIVAGIISILYKEYKIFFKEKF